MSGVRLVCYPAPWSNDFQFQIRDGDGWCESIVMSKRDESEPIEPAFRLSYEAAQDLFNDLYRQGFRPSKADADSALEVMRAHLADMRSLVFKKQP